MKQYNSRKREILRNNNHGTHVPPVNVLCNTQCKKKKVVEFKHSIVPSHRGKTQIGRNVETNWGVLCANKGFLVV